MAGLRGKWSGRIIRGGIALLPLVFIISLCIFMLGWRGHSAAEAHAATPDKAATLTSTALSASDDASEEDASDLLNARFQRRHITHAAVRVPQ